MLLRTQKGYRLWLLARQIDLADSRKLIAEKLCKGETMIRRIYLAAAAVVLIAAMWSPRQVRAEEQAYGRAWGHTYNTLDWERFYHYPYVYYPQNFWGNEYFRSADSLYYRYPPEMRIPDYNRHWFNDYPTPRPYYRGAHFVLDIF